MQDEMTGTQGEVDVVDTAIENAGKSENEGNAEETTEATDDQEAEEVDPAKENEKLKKALKKKNRHMSNLRQRLRALEAQQEGFKKSETDSKPPEMDGYESVMDYIEARNQYLLEQKLGEKDQAQKLSQVESEKQAIRAQQTQQFSTEVAEIVRTAPEFGQLLSENAPIFEHMPKQLDELLYEIDNAPAAVYALLKEGRFTDLYALSPYVAAAELVAAASRGEQYMQAGQSATPRIQTAHTAQPAPKPLSRAKGTGKSSQRPADLSPDDIVKRYM